MTNEEKNTAIIAARIAAFKARMDSSEGMWHRDDVLLMLCFLMLVGAGDNIAKNFYPYSFGVKKVKDGIEVAIDGKKWRLRNDDLDTIFPADNQGLDRKPYWTEWFDKYSDGQYIVNAAEGAFIALWWKAYFNSTTDQGFVIMRSMLEHLEELGEVSADSHLNMLLGWYDKYYASAKKAFPSMLVNDDMMRYERARVAQLSGTKGSYTEVNPLRQENGDHCVTDRGWVKKRLVYIMSMCSFGDFAHDASSGTITFRLNGTATFSLTPSIKMYPTGTAGQTVIRGARTDVGESCQIQMTGTDLDSMINGADWLSDIGEWYNVPIRNNLTVNAKMLKRLVLGTDDVTKIANMSINISGLTIGNCPSLRMLDVQNVSSLTGGVDLSICRVLEEVYAAGSSLTSITIPSGAPLTVLDYASTNQNIILRNLPLLENSGIGSAACAENVSMVVISNCPSLKSMELVASIMEAQKSQTTHILQRVYMDGFDETYNDAIILTYLSALATGYQAVDKEGQDISGVPILSGILRFTCPVYKDEMDILNDTFGAGGLTIVADTFYIRFEDSRVWEICCYNWGDTKLIAPGTSFATGKIDADGSDLVASDYVFASCLVHPQRTYSDGTSPAQVAAAARTFEIELQFNSANPFSDIAAESTVIEICQYGSNTTTSTVVGTLAKEDVVLDSNNKLTITTTGTTNACQYLTVAVLANNGVKATYNIKVASSSESGIYQPVGITQAQCAAVSSLGTVFAYNRLLITANEIKYFTGVTSIGDLFRQCENLQTVEISENVLSIKYTFYKCYKLGSFDTKNIESCLGQAFNWTSISEMVFNEGFKTLGGMVLRDTTMTYLELPSTVTDVGYWNWPTSGEVVICKAVNPPILASSYAGNNKGAVYVPDEAYNDYIVATNWSDLYSRGLIKKKSELPEEYKSRWP